MTSVPQGVATSGRTLLLTAALVQAITIVVYLLVILGEDTPSAVAVTTFVVLLLVALAAGTIGLRGGNLTDPEAHGDFLTKAREPVDSPRLLAGTPAKGHRPRRSSRCESG